MNYIKQNIKIDIEEAIQYYNEKNPSKKPLNQKDLASSVSIPVHKQMFSQWKNKVPKSIVVLKEVSEITGYPLKKLITTKDE